MDINDYQLISKIGKGGFGLVYKVKNIKTGKEYAAKVMIADIDETESEELPEIKNLKREIKIMLSIDHPAVLKFKGYSPIDLEGNKKPTILTEYMPNGSLEDILKLERRSNAHEYWNDTRKLINIYGIASAMLYLHSHDIIHRDLKPENILMDKYLFPKVADFGLSKSINQTYATQSTKSPQGTPAYIAPEIWGHSAYSPASDVYSFSLIVYEIMTNDRPFEECGLFEILAKLSSKQRPEFKSPVPEAYMNLIQRCWAEEPDERPTFKEIVNMLQEDPGFITECVDESDFLHYVDIINQHKDTFGDLNAEFSIDDYIKRDTSTFTQVSISQFFNQDRKVKIVEGQKIIENDPNSNHNSGEIELQNGISVNDDNGKLDINEKSNLNMLSLRNMGNTQITDIKKFALALYNGDGMEKDKKRAARYFKIAADQGQVDSMILYADMSYKGDGIPVNYEEAAEYYKMASDKGSAEATNSYGNLLFEGKGVKQNKEEAANYYKKAADNDNFNAMNNYANMLFKGDSIPVDKEKAADYFKKAADNDHIYAMYNYGLMLVNGNGIDTDKVNGISYIQKAADKGHIYACNFYADYLVRNGLCNQDNEKVTKYLKMAADKNLNEAVFKYGAYLYTGFAGIKSDKNEGSKYIKRAYELGVDDAKQFLISKELEESCSIC